MTLLNPQPSWLIIDNSSFTGAVNVTIQGETNANVGNYTIEVILGDTFNLNPTNNTYINISIYHNYPPKNVSVLVNTISTTIPWGFNHTLNTSVFVDAEGDQVIILCTTVTTNAPANDVSFAMWYYSMVQKNLTFYGQEPLDNQYAGTYIY